MAGAGTMRTATASAVSVCMVLRIERDRMLEILHEEHSFSDFFMHFILSRGIRTQADLRRSTLQLQRKAPGEDTAPDGRIWEG